MMPQMDSGLGNAADVDRNTPATKGAPARLDALLVGVLLAPYLFLVHRFWFTTDDAFISFRYSQNLARGLGLRYNVGDPPVEGYSNFLWTVVCAAFEWARMDITVWPLVLSAACGAALILLVYHALRRDLQLEPGIAFGATLTLACFPPLGLWATSGMETMAFALLIFATFRQLILRREGPDGIGGGLAALLLSLVRLEGIAWVAIIFAMALFTHWRRRDRRMHRLLIAAAIVCIGFGLYFAWRASYYQSWMPNTATAKGELDWPRLTRGFNYVATTFLTFCTPFLILPGGMAAIRPARAAVGVPVAAMAIGFPLYAIVVTGDFMTMGRFLLPAWPFATILLAWLLQDLCSVGTLARRVVAPFAVTSLIVLAGLPAWNIHAVPESVRANFHFRFNSPKYATEYERWLGQIRNVVKDTPVGVALRSYAARRLDSDRATIVVSGCGVKGYYSGLTILDQYGLVTPEIAARKLSPTDPLKSPGHDKWVPAFYFAKDRPDILVHGLEAFGSARELVVALENWALGLRGTEDFADYYAPDFARVREVERDGTPAFLLTWRIIPKGADAAQPWDDFARRIRDLRSGAVQLDDL